MARHQPTSKPTAADTHKLQGVPVTRMVQALKQVPQSLPGFVLVKPGNDGKGNPHKK